MARYTYEEEMIQVTMDWIKAVGTPIALNRYGKALQDGAGGFAGASSTPVTLAPVQRVLAAAAINVRSGNTREFFQDASGERYQIKYVLIGPPNDDVQANDWFDYHTERMRVLDVDPNRSFETRAQIIAWGGEPVG